MDSSFASRIIAALVLILMLVVPLILWDQAKRADARLRAITPASLSFIWGYLYGLAGLCFGGIASIGLLAEGLLPTPPYSPARSPDPTALVYLVLWAIPLTISCYFVLRRKRWAWIVATMLSLNPVIWLINFVYGRRRWREMMPNIAKEAGLSGQTKFVSQGNGSQAENPVAYPWRRSAEKMIIVIVGLALVLALLFPPHTIQIREGAIYSTGFKFLFHDGMEMVNSGLLMIELIVILIMGGLVWFLLRR